ncbi:DUF1657 domain-containing protein [Paenactinomyces guangxiensis]|uniref:DUF1657 domain-containing protein n=1 Tax=Paenactinomyces guangxiensis TaxID=1490290 RepID=A0A7W1WSE0_9BACL|nr:DUF1657 domain-containing protein [Paenactinomyces guangxiensis]MBA4494966.1 DUF1657 domain-containing protein [Paenactinomyces guangxiensis]MBH8592049.1 DUF1657 domain-containing protein [Paenactinomyces guangxiensis]
MTTYSKVKQTLVSLEGAKATMEMYGQIAQDEQARKTFRRNAQRLDVVLERLEKRLQTLEFEEPQFKGF